MASKGNAEVNYVHQNAILCETIKKEQRNHKLYTNYSINPFKKSKKEISVKHDMHLFVFLKISDDFDKIQVLIG